MQVLRARALLTALVGRQQGLAEPGHTPTIRLEPGPDLRDHVGKRDAEGQPVSPDVAATAFARDGGCYLGRLRADYQGTGPDLPGDGQLVTGPAGQDNVLASPGPRQWQLRLPRSAPLTPVSSVLGICASKARVTLSGSRLLTHCSLLLASC